LTSTTSNFFFFYCYAAHRDLHSFPTRRSSDLDVNMLQLVALLHPVHQRRTDVCGAEAVYAQVQQRVRHSDARIGNVRAYGVPVRSEEHRLNSSHRTISYAVFCLKKKKKKRKIP